MESNTHTVSIIVPVYNVSAYIERCIKSVMNQTYNDIECIIVDDATPDDSIVKCERLIAAYDGPIRFSILHHQQNRGLSAAGNTGTEVATGEYLYYLDSDDEITSDCVETLLKPMIEDNSIELVQGNHIEEQDGQEMIYYKGSSPIYISNRDEVYNHYLKYHHICACAWNKLMRSSFVEHYQLYFKEGILYEDRLWMFYVQKHLKIVYICKDITYYYHIRPHSITREKGKAVGNSCHIIYQDILNHLTRGDEKTELCGYAYGFCKPYCIYVNEVPALKDTYNLYRQQAKRFKCWYVYILLTLVGVVRRFGNPMGILKLLHTIRWRLMELPDVIFNRSRK
ncbi:MAG: glycosyltransferase family 2 protein [Prevotella sp.]|nr:glycosyltransferase family 2 protein [Prevotella sp.]